MYRQAQLKEDLPQRERERKKIHNRSLWTTNEAVSAVLNKKKYLEVPLNVYVARAPRQMLFQVFCRKRLSEISKFFATIRLQRFTFKECLGRHHRLQIDNDLRSALESENLFSNSFCATSQRLLSEKTSNRPLYAAYFG